MQACAAAAAAAGLRYFGLHTQPASATAGAAASAAVTRCVAGPSPPPPSFVSLGGSGESGACGLLASGKATQVSASRV